MTEKGRKAQAEYNKRYRLKHKERVNEYQREYRKMHPEKAQKWRETYWDKKAEMAAHSNGGDSGNE